ncbi:MAG TPA: GNAT family N-acetyltransferase [Pyrinomonadaceae bacterium]|nr:GNAT family N-acetyltransferase [Pyrinomonadaceae bacterium]
MLAPLSVDTNSINCLRSVELGGAHELTTADHEEVLSFLGTHTLHTGYLTGLVRDHGIVSPNNRGTFYGYRDSSQQLEGVALIGHAIVMEAKTDQALKAFAAAAQRCTTAHLILCEENRMDQFWRLYAQGGQEMRRASRQLQFELRWPTEVTNARSGLRLAALQDLEQLIPVHAEMAREESGVDPMVVDPIGFVQRYTKRIEKGRTWVSMINGKLIFKAEVINESPGVTYIEGVWVNPELRRQGYGLGCMSQLSRMLLWRTKSLCLLVNDENEAAARFVKQAGYHLRGVYDTIFLK